MKVNRPIGVATATLTLLTLLATPNLAAPHRLTSLLATAKRQGTLTVGKEEFEVSYMVVKLKEDGTGEITVVTDLQLFVTCTWSVPGKLSEGIKFENYRRNKSRQLHGIRETFSTTGWKINRQHLRRGDERCRKEKIPA